MARPSKTVRDKKFKTLISRSALIYEYLEFVSDEMLIDTLIFEFYLRVPEFESSYKKLLAYHLLQYEKYQFQKDTYQNISRRFELFAPSAIHKDNPGYRNLRPQANEKVTFEKYGYKTSDIEQYIIKYLQFLSQTNLNSQEYSNFNPAPSFSLELMLQYLEDDTVSYSNSIDRDKLIELAKVKTKDIQYIAIDLSLPKKTAIIEATKQIKELYKNSDANDAKVLSDELSLKKLSNKYKAQSLFAEYFYLYDNSIKGISNNMMIEQDEIYKKSKLPEDKKDTKVSKISPITIRKRIPYMQDRLSSLDFLFLYW